MQITEVRLTCGSHIKNSKLKQTLYYKASLGRDFMSLFPIHPDFGNSAEEFHPYETLSTPMKLLSSFFINMTPHQHN
jgi:hypothetical protein